jgi:hypothetical protein
MSTEAKRALSAKHRPDLVLYETHRRPQRHKYTFVEIRYCRDTQPQDQIDRAIAQHAELLQTLKNYNAAGNVTVELVVLPLGMAGTIYSGVSQDMKEKLRSEWNSPRHPAPQPALPCHQNIHQNHKVQAH